MFCFKTISLTRGNGFVLKKRGAGLQAEVDGGYFGGLIRPNTAGPVAPVQEQCLAKRGGDHLQLRWPYPGGRREAKRLAKMGERGHSKIR